MKTLIVLMLSGLSVFASDITGSVVLPNGQPAAGAQVGLAVPGDSFYLLHAKMQKYTGVANLLVKADQEGHFSFPTNEKAWAIVAMNEAGCTQVEKENFENGSKIILQPWARIEGVLHVGTGVGTNQQVVLNGGSSRRFFFDLGSFQDITDSDGKFVFSYVPAGNWIISHSGETIWDGTNVTVKAGETNRVTIGGTGRPVIGKLLIPAFVTNSLDHLVTSRGGNLFSSQDPTGKWASYSVDVTLYGDRRELTAHLAPDGTFRAEDVPAGTWWLLADILSFPKGGGSATTVATTGRSFVVPEMPSGRSDEPLNLGTLKPVPVHSPEIGEAAPALEVKITDGGTFNLADHRGQYVLLDFELTDFGFGKTNELVQTVWDAFGKNNRLAMLTLKVPPSSGSFAYFTGHEPQYSWPQARLYEVPWYESKPLRASYGLETDRVEMDPNLPAIFLVGPDGNIVAKKLHGDDIKAAVTKALGN